ncbi:hypothetical protein B0O80DRAFT_491341 [Mortierella sp. GBAus27b]|nr:hypothetical protein B0O80DRAFT_491341 [Mortierella sp. GBAus27b]
MKELAAIDAFISTYNQSIGNWGLMDQKLTFELSDLNGKEQLRRLREVPTEELLTVASRIVPGAFHLCYDGGKVIPSKVPIQVLAWDLSAYDPNIRSVLIGTTKDEGTAFAKWPSILKRCVPVPELIHPFESVYGKPQTDKDVSPIAGRYNGDSVFYCPTQVLVDKLRELAETRKGFKMSQFRFDVAMQRLTELAPGLGAMHVGELPFVFNPEDTTPVMIEKELAVSKEMQLVWIGFANNDADISTTKNIQFTFTDDQTNGTDENGSNISREAPEWTRLSSSNWML